MSVEPLDFMFPAGFSGQVWLTSDQHYCHGNVIKLCERPFVDRQSMHDEMIRLHNEKVKPEDLVFHLGDFCFGGTGAKKAFIGALNGYKVLVHGNHDDKPHKMLSHGFNEVHHCLRVTLEGCSVIISHYPYAPATSDQLPAKEHRYPERRPLDQGGLLLHGHVHTSWQVNGRMLNVGVDRWGFAPVSWYQALVTLRLSKLLKGIRW